MVHYVRCCGPYLLGLPKVTRTAVLRPNARITTDMTCVAQSSGRPRLKLNEHLFGRVWSDETLSIRDRRLVVLGTLGALGDLGNLTLHMRQALHRGDLTKEELDEVVVQITHYAGWPRGTVALQAAGQAAAEHDKK